LTVSLGRTAGRNQYGRITSRWMGGGHKRLYRMIDFRGYDKMNIPAKVASVEYDPYRTVRIALLNYVDGEKRYVLAWKGIKVGMTVMTGDQAPLEHGCRKLLKDIPEGFNIFNLEYTTNTKGKTIKSAGSFGVLVGKDEALRVVFVKLPSGEVRKFNEKCWATIGQLGNEDHKNIVIGKAGRSRWMGLKGNVLGKSMNPVDHPHGGGEGHAEIGLRFPKSHTGKPVPPGKKTRKTKKWSTKFIVSKRTKN
jgi:large subunit ribosomal protein L2